MPFKSKKQRGWMFANIPEIAQRWVDKYGSKIKTRKSPAKHR